jgi:hypothetical protein
MKLFLKGGQPVDIAKDLFTTSGFREFALSGVASRRMMLFVKAEALDERQHRPERDG